MNSAGPNVGRVSILSQNGMSPGTFAAPTAFIYGSNQAPFELVVTDLQLDGSPDALASEPGVNGFRVLLHDPATRGVLLPARQFGRLAGPNGGRVKLAAGDLDLDGLPDVVLVNDTQVVYHLQDAANPGSFLAGRFIGEGAAAVQIVDGDGLADVVTFDAGSATDRALYYRHDPALIGRSSPQSPSLSTFPGSRSRSATSTAILAATS